MISELCAQGGKIRTKRRRSRKRRETSPGKGEQNTEHQKREKTNRDRQLRTVHLFDLLNLLLPESLQLLFLQVLVMKLWLRNGERTPRPPPGGKEKQQKKQHPSEEKQHQWLPTFPSIKFSPQPSISTHETTTDGRAQNQHADARRPTLC
jgi:hypothetical protein